MNYSLNIMILEDDINACERFRHHIEQYKDLSITTITNDSYIALDALNKQIPDAIILALELNKGKGNGLLFLQEMNKRSLPFKPYILVTTNNSSSVTLDLYAVRVLISLCPNINRITPNKLHLISLI